MQYCGVDSLRYCVLLNACVVIVYCAYCYKSMTSILKYSKQTSTIVKLNNYLHSLPTLYETLE